jgi:hypothetical protein
MWHIWILPPQPILQFQVNPMGKFRKTGEIDYSCKPVIIGSISYRTDKIMLTYIWPIIFNLDTFLHFKTTLYHTVHLNFCPFIGSLNVHAKYSLCSSLEIDKLTSRINIPFTFTSDSLIMMLSMQSAHWSQGQEEFEEPKITQQ